MKRIIALLLAAAIFFPLCGCGKKAKFEDAYTQTYQELALLCESSEKLAGFVADVWDHMGANRLIDTLSYMLTIDEDLEAFTDIFNKNRDGSIERWIGIAYDWAIGTKGDKILLSWDQETFHGMCMEYQQLFGAVYNANAALGETIKEMRSEYGKRFDEEFALLNDLYIEASTYAEFCLNPTGSLKDFNQRRSDYDVSTDKLLKAADIY